MKQSMYLGMSSIVRFSYFFLCSVVIVNGKPLSEVTQRIKKCNEYHKICPLEASPINIEGEVAASKEFPFMALIGYDRYNKSHWPCSGSLISDNFVVTVGHCIASTGFSVQYVRLGELDFNNEDDDADVQQFNVTESFFYPEYSNKGVYHDIALLKLDRTVEFSEYIQPACLPRSDTEIPDRVLATAWGLTSLESWAQPSILQKVALNLVPPEVCNETYTAPSQNIPSGISSETQLCAGSKYGERDACWGFDGGPLINTGRKLSCLYEIVGVHSFSTGCGFGNPGVYTNISSYIDWIESIVWDVK